MFLLCDLAAFWLQVLSCYHRAVEPALPTITRNLKMNLFPALPLSQFLGRRKTSQVPGLAIAQSAMAATQLVQDMPKPE